MPRGIVYLRKSTDDTKRQMLSLKAQRRVSTDLCRQFGIQSVRKYEESKSAKAPGRPYFNQMLDDFEHGKADGIVCWALNRLFRNPVDEGRVRWLLQRGIIKFIRTATREYLPADAGLLLAVEGGQASDELTKFRANVARGLEQKLLDGAWPAPRAPGYSYDYIKKNIIPHPRFGKLATKVFEEVSVGGRSMDWVSDRLFELGFRSRKGKRWSKSKVHAFLTNKIYMGLMVWKGKAYEGKYQPLVSPELFALVQKRLSERSKPRKTRHLKDFPLRGLFRCKCGAMLTAQLAKGNGGLYRYYRCGRTKGFCDERYLPERGMIAQLLALLSPITLGSSQTFELRGILDRLRVDDEQHADDQIAVIDAELSAAQQQLNNLTLACARLQIDDDGYTAASTNLLTRKASLKRKKQRIDETSGTDWFEPAMEVVSVLELAAKSEPQISVHDLASTIRKVATNHWFSGKTVGFDWAEPYAYTAQLLGSARVSAADGQSSGYTGLDSRPDLLQLATYLRTYFRENRRG